MAMIARIPPPSREEFERSYVRPARPVIIRGALPQLSAEELSRRFGDRMVPVAVTEGGRMPHDASRGYAYRQSRLDEFLRNPSGYSIFVIEDLLPELKIERPAFLPDSRWSMHKLWISPADTRAPLHQDLPENLYAQLVGQKRVTLFAPGEARHLYRQPLWSRLPNFSRVDAEAPDLDRFPRFARARPLTAELDPGDLLYLPRRWWHQMRSLDFSISVSTWWAAGLVDLAVRAALLYKRLRGLRY
jgi:lysine-specific demethylase 8